MRILILANSGNGLYKFRIELIRALLGFKNEIFISFPNDKISKKFTTIGCKYIETSIERRGVNIFKDLRLFRKYKKIIRNINPNVVLTYTIKPNIYGGLASKKLNIPYIANITGLGTALENKSLIQLLLVLFYKIAFSNVKMVFFQNQFNLNFFQKNGIVINKYRLIPGSGVNLEFFQVLEYPKTETIEFVFISRIMKEKGIEQYLETAEYITNKYPTARFHVCGYCEEMYEDKLETMHRKGIIIYHGQINDVRVILSKTHCTIHPSYYPEGMSNVLLESAASGRPIISTNRSGCREIIENGINGFIINTRNTENLIEKVEKFLSLSYEEKKRMGLAGREKAEKEFNRQKVVDAYLEEIEAL